MDKKLEWLVRTAHNSHHKCEYKQDGEPRKSVKCKGCCHSAESYERDVRNVLNYVAQETKKAEVRGRVDEADYWLHTLPLLHSWPEIKEAIEKRKATLQAEEGNKIKSGGLE